MRCLWLIVIAACGDNLTPGDVAPSDCPKHSTWDAQIQTCACVAGFEKNANGACVWHGTQPSAEPADPASLPCEGPLGFPGVPTIRLPTGDTSTFPVVLSPKIIDVDGDGKIDIIWRTYVEVGVALGHGDGTFSSTLFPMENINSGLAVGDANGDGKVDVITATTDPSTHTATLHVALNNGAGFDPAQAFDSGVAVDNGFGLLAAADLNGDGRADVIGTAYNSTTTIFVLLSTPTGFGAAQVLPPRQWVAATAVGDITGDGHPDVVIAGYGGSSGPVVSIFANTGNGVLTPPVSIATPQATPGALALVDLNDDGLLDVVFGDNDASTAFIGVVLNEGTGAFFPVMKHSVGSPGQAPTALAAADVDADGNLDVGVVLTSVDTMGSRDHTTTVLLGNGLGQFGGQLALGVGAYSTLDLVDFDGDNRPDIVFDALWPVLNNGTAQPFEAYEVGRLGFPRMGSRSLRLLDLDHDSKLDLVGIGEDYSSGPAGVIATRFGRGDGSFFETTTTYSTQVVPGFSNPSGSIPDAFDSGTLTDLNNDGRQDLVIVGSGVQSLINQNNGTFALASPAGADGASLAAGDFNNDGVRDMVVRGEAIWGNPAPIWYLAGHGDGTFSNPVLIAKLGITCAAGVAALDVDGDGWQDLVVDAGELDVMIGQGDGTFAPPQSLAVSFAGIRNGPTTALVAHDVNSDGKLDLVSAERGGIHVAINNGDGTFSPRQSPARESVVTEFGSFPAFADFNGDGHLDMVAREEVFMGRGDGTFESAGMFSGIGFRNAVNVADIDGDGMVDIVSSGFGDRFNVLRGRCLAR